MKTECEHVGPNRTKCMRSTDHEGLHSSRTPVFGEYGRADYNRRDQNIIIWNDAKEIAPPEYGCSVPLNNLTEIEKIINTVLLKDARRTLEEGKVIEIRMKLCGNGIAWYYLSSPEDCPDGFENQYSMQQEPLFDFNGDIKMIELGGYYLLARIKL